MRLYGAVESIEKYGGRSDQSTASDVGKIASTFEAELFHVENWNRSMKFLFK
jgi:hypothetical protein